MYFNAGILVLFASISSSVDLWFFSTVIIILSANERKLTLFFFRKFQPSLKYFPFSIKNRSYRLDVCHPEGYQKPFTFENGLLNAPIILKDSLLAKNRESPVESHTSLAAKKPTRDCKSPRRDLGGCYDFEISFEISESGSRSLADSLRRMKARFICGWMRGCFLQLIFLVGFGGGL